MYSGTLAAATEAVTKGMKAVASSTSMKYYDKAAEHLEEILTYLDSNGLWALNSLYNVYIPVDPRGFRITRLGDESFSVEFLPQGNDLYYPGGHPIRADGGDITKDTDACALGYISVTPLTVDRTARDVFEKLNK
jgi:5'-nucleotidase